MMNKISDLVVFAITDTTNTYKEINFGFIPNWQGQKIAASTSVNVKGAKKILSAHGIRHALNGHGNDVLERERGSVGIKGSDFELIPTILDNPDSVINGNKGRNGFESLVFIKAINYSEYNIVMSLSPSKEGRNFIFNTMFIKNKKPMKSPA